MSQLNYPISIIALILGCVFVFSLVLTLGVRIFALRRAILAIPNERSSHQVPMPCVGGIAIVTAFLLTVLALYFVGYIPSDITWALTGGVLLLACVGYIDDIKSLPAYWRALTHFIAAAWALYWLGGFPPIVLGIKTFNLGWVGNILATLGIVWLINLYNFMDGIDGFAGMEGMFVAIAAGFFISITSSTHLALLCLVLAAAIGGFLVWNWPPAKIFMGDVGSSTLGFIFAVLLIASTQANVPGSPIFWIILLAIFVADATFTLLRRILRGEQWYSAHRSHAFQYLIRRGASHLQVTFGTLLFNLVVILPLAYFALKRPHWAPCALLVTGLGCWLLWWRITQEKP